MTGFVHLHCHSSHSFLEGASGIGDLVCRAASLGMRALALTDTNGLYGAVPFYLAARSAAVKPIIGAEIRDEEARLILLARDLAGYRALCGLLTSFHLSGKRIRPGPAGEGGGFRPLLRAVLREGAPGLFVILPACRLLRLLPRGAAPPVVYLEAPAAAGAPRVAALARTSSPCCIPSIAIVACAAAAAFAAIRPASSRAVMLLSPAAALAAASAATYCASSVPVFPAKRSAAPRRCCSKDCTSPTV